MKLSQLRPCDNCGGRLQLLFYQITVSPTVIDRSAVGQTLGLAQFFSAGEAVCDSHLSIAEALTPTPEATRSDPNLDTEICLCQDCYLKSGLCIAQLCERC